MPTHDCKNLENLSVILRNVRQMSQPLGIKEEAAMKRYVSFSITTLSVCCWLTWQEKTFMLRWSSPLKEEPQQSATTTEEVNVYRFKADLESEIGSILLACLLHIYSISSEKFVVYFFLSAKNKMLVFKSLCLCIWNNITWDIFHPLMYL